MNQSAFWGKMTIIYNRIGFVLGEKKKTEECFCLVFGEIDGLETLTGELTGRFI